MYRKIFSSLRGIDGLFSQFPEQSISSTKVIIQLVKYNGSRGYMLFDSYLELFKNIDDSIVISGIIPAYFEVIRGNSCQKPRFDIDCSSNISRDILISSLINANVKVLSEKNIILDVERDFLVFDSSNYFKFGDFCPSGKISIHIILCNYYHSNNKEALAYYQEVIKHIPESIRKYIDSSVYGSIQHFRIYRCQKLPSNVEVGRPKIFLEEFNYLDNKITYKFSEKFINNNHKKREILRLSLLGCIDGCIELPSFYKEELKNNNLALKQEAIAQFELMGYDVSLLKNEPPIEIEITKEDAISALSLVFKKFEISDNTFSILKIISPIICLKRIKRSFCVVCGRIHDNENPFLLIFGKNKSVYFDCRRSEGIRSFIGNLGGNKDERNIEDENIIIPKYILNLFSKISSDWSPEIDQNEKDNKRDDKRDQNEKDIKIDDKRDQNEKDNKRDIKIDQNEKDIKIDNERDSKRDNEKNQNERDNKKDNKRSSVIKLNQQRINKGKLKIEIQKTRAKLLHG